ncbi:DUF1566 domain-containing protein [Methylobacter sp. G7]|uniref:DUF1566 domain-containing protein n=1 Tax=Methylobacter sp. G7 TaxID=3230117 RepID=UPI003D806185
MKHHQFFTLSIIGTMFAMLLAMTSASADQPSYTPYTIGEEGPGGGIVFYLDHTGVHGLEAKRKDEVNQANVRNNKVGVLFYWGDAKAAASAYGSDWHLPTKNELDLLHKQKDVVGGFKYTSYWTSSTEGLNDPFYAAWRQNFFTDDDGIQAKAWAKGMHAARAVRAF